MGEGDSSLKYDKNGDVIGVEKSYMGSWVANGGMEGINRDLLSPTDARPDVVRTDRPGDTKASQAVVLKDQVR